MAWACTRPRQPAACRPASTRSKPSSAAARGHQCQPPQRNPGKICLAPRGLPRTLLCCVMVKVSHKIGKHGNAQSSASRQ
jgi:hypothetical protein